MKKKRCRYTYTYIQLTEGWLNFDITSSGGISMNFLPHAPKSYSLSIIAPNQYDILTSRGSRASRSVPSLCVRSTATIKSTRRLVAISKLGRSIIPKRCVARWYCNHTNMSDCYDGDLFSEASRTILSSKQRNVAQQRRKSILEALLKMHLQKLLSVMHFFSR